MELSPMEKIGLVFATILIVICLVMASSRDEKPKNIDSCLKMCGSNEVISFEKNLKCICEGTRHEADK